MKFNTFNSAQETSSVNLKKRVGAAVAAVTVGLTGAACSAGDGGVRQYSGSAKGESLLYGQPCYEHEDKIMDTGGLSVIYALGPNAVDRTMRSLEQNFYDDSRKSYGFGSEDVELSPQQTRDIEAGTEAMLDDLFAKNPNMARDEQNVSIRINVLNKDGEGRIKDGYIDGRMCVDAGIDSTNAELDNYGK